jgi:hypothetical protein
MNFRYDDMNSTPSSPIYRPQRGAFIEVSNPCVPWLSDPNQFKILPPILKENAGSYSDLSRKNSLVESLPRKASLTELSDDEIIIAYHNLLKQQQQPQPQQPQQVKEQKNDENYREFLRWMEMKRNEDDKSVPQAIPSNDIKVEEEKVNTSDKNDAHISVVAAVDEAPMSAVADEKVSVATIETENDCDEFEDAETDEAYLSVPLVIREDADDEVNVLIPTIVEEKSTPTEKANEEVEADVVSAKLTLTNDALQIAANLSKSQVSLASSDDSKKKPAKHTKGRAPPPPPATQQPPPPSTSNVIEGFFYDELTKRHFKETEL